MAEYNASRFDDLSVRVNKVVQWVRGRFNEVLEKAEFVRLKLIDAQRRLPSDHHCHPNNHSLESAGSGGSVDVLVSPGVTAEKLMYDRALEMSRAAAINELTSEDLSGCKIAYGTAVLMLEAVLESEEVQHSGKRGSNDKGDKIVLGGVQDEDRDVVVKCKLGLLFSSPVYYSDFLCSGVQHTRPVAVIGKQTGCSHQATNSAVERKDGAVEFGTRNGGGCCSMNKQHFLRAGSCMLYIL